MTKAKRIRYLCDVQSNIELIFCDSSTISYPLHNHVSVFIIGMVLDGSMILNTNYTENLYTKNHTFIIPPYAPHSVRSKDSYSLLSLCVNKDFLNCPGFDLDRAASDITNLVTCALGPDKLEQGQLSQLLSCLHSLNTISPLPSKRINDPHIDGLKKELELFPENKFSVEQMALSALTSKYYFIRRFKQAVGLTPHQFQIQNRIRKAQRLIGQAGTITEVALTTGFCDQSHFIRQFEKHLGLTPSAYKLSSGMFSPSGADQQSAGINLANR